MITFTVITFNFTYSVDLFKTFGARFAASNQPYSKKFPKLLKCATFDENLMTMAFFFGNWNFFAAKCAQKTSKIRPSI